VTLILAQKVLGCKSAGFLRNFYCGDLRRCTADHQKEHGQDERERFLREKVNHR
jgi:hypothetical protein